MTKTSFENQQQVSLWQALDSKEHSDHPLYAWLACQHSLTEELAKHLNASIEVCVLNEYKTPLSNQERALLNTHNMQLKATQSGETDLNQQSSGDDGFARDIILHSDGIGYIGARTIMSEMTWNQCQLAALGTRPIGTLLFDNPINSQRYIEVQVYPQLHSSEWSDFLSIQHDKSQPIWARRSVFMLQHQPMIIHELFSDRLI